MLHIIMYARVVELVDTLVLGTSASRREGSSPFSRTKTRIYGFAVDLCLFSSVNVV